MGCPFICDCWKVPSNRTIVVDCSYRNITNPLTNVHSMIKGGWARNYNYSLNLAGNDITDLNYNNTQRECNISPIETSWWQLEYFGSCVLQRILLKSHMT
jgi:hypothetical protein